MTASATISVDVDPVDIHLAGYGHFGTGREGVVYTSALPRLCDLLGDLDAKATFFVVARDAAERAPALAALARDGHEIASHSLTHPAPFLRLPREELAREIEESRRRLEETCGTPVVGFRAPNWDMGREAVGPLARAGYRYDASAFPSPFLVAARAALAIGGSVRAAARMRTLPCTLSRRPFTWRDGTAEIREFPISVTPRLRFPIYHTMRWVLGEARFLRALDGFARRGEPFFYPLHAIDALGLAEDRVDPRLRRHPGMDRPLAAKLEVLRGTLRAIAERFRIVTYRDLL